tara:strand:+ start:3846 stop:4196 length:351 start_codon:yes stop_codon:yes gene_type:complete
MGKAKDGSECFTKTTKGGGKYVTCKGAQDKRVKRAKLKSGGPKAPMVKKAVKAKVAPKGKGTGGLKKKLGATKIAKPEVVGSVSYAAAVKKGIISQKQADKLSPALLTAIIKKKNR